MSHFTFEREMEEEFTGDRPRSRKKPRLPTEYQRRWLRRIAQSALMVTKTPEFLDRYSLQSGETIPSNTAKVLIRNGWVEPEKDGLFDEPQTYRALSP